MSNRFLSFVADPVDLTEEQPITQELFMQRYSRNLLGEDAQIMRRFLKLKMPFIRAPAVEKPVPFFTVMQLSEMSARFDHAYHHPIKYNEQTQQSEHDGIYKEAPKSQSSVNDESFVTIEEGSGKAGNKDSFKQAEADNDDFFGGSGVAADDDLSPPKKKKPKRREPARTPPKPNRSRAEVEKFTPDGWQKFNYSKITNQKK